MSVATTLRLEALAQYFHLPIKDVAKELGVCMTILKRICRRNGISRWPHRKIVSLDKRIATLELAIKSSANSQEINGFRQEIQELRDHRLSLVTKQPTPSNKLKKTISKNHQGTRSKSSKREDDSSSDGNFSDNDSPETSSRGGSPSPASTTSTTSTPLLSSQPASASATNFHRLVAPSSPPAAGNAASESQSLPSLAQVVAHSLRPEPVARPDFLSYMPHLYANPHTAQWLARAMPPTAAVQMTPLHHPLYAGSATHLHQQHTSTPLQSGWALQPMHAPALHAPSVATQSFIPQPASLSLVVPNTTPHPLTLFPPASSPAVKSAMPPSRAISAAEGLFSLCELADLASSSSRAVPAAPKA